MIGLKKDKFIDRKFRVGFAFPFWFVVWLSVISLSANVSAVQIPNTQTLLAQEIEQLGIDYMLEHHPISDEDTEMVIDYKGQDVVLPMGSLDFNIKMTQNHPNSIRIPLLMTINVDGVFRKGLWMTAHIKSYADVVKARRAIQPGVVLTEEDVKVERGLVDSSHHRYAVRLGEVIGFKTTRNFRAGTPVDLRYLVRTPLVKRGDRVLIVAKKGPMRITTPGIVREKGFRGTIVSVENVESKKVVYGEVVNSSLVEVKF